MVLTNNLRGGLIHFGCCLDNQSISILIYNILMIPKLIFTKILFVFGIINQPQYQGLKKRVEVLPRSTLNCLEASPQKWYLMPPASFGWDGLRWHVLLPHLISGMRRLHRHRWMEKTYVDMMPSAVNLKEKKKEKEREEREPRLLFCQWSRCLQPQTLAFAITNPYLQVCLFLSSMRSQT